MPDHDAHPLGEEIDSHRQQAEKLKKTIDESHGMWGAGDLKYAVHDALQLAAPKGDSGKLGGSRGMWWNFIGRTHDDILRAREEWQAAADRFGAVQGYP